MKCRLVGGPFDGRWEEKNVGTQTIALKSDRYLMEVGQKHEWAIYRRPIPDVATADGLVEFYFDGIQDNIPE